jgi:ferredoxin-type protein NapH
MKKSQLVMIWLLPVIVIGGFLNPMLGYLVIGMMAFLLAYSFFKGRYWCNNLCPRGAFLDATLPMVSLKRPVPKIFTKQWFRWSVAALFMAFLIFRIMRSGGSVMAIGAVFVTMCLLTTIISIILGVLTRHRGWCIICPMGTFQEKINSFNRSKVKKTGQLKVL